MKNKQRVILLGLILLSLVYQGVRWQAGSGVVETVLDLGPAGVRVQAASEPERHCSLVHVNTAGMAELQTLPGIGPVYAERIIIERREKPFVRKRDLLRVAGIGEKRLADRKSVV